MTEQSQDLMQLMRSQYFEEEGAYSSDQEILQWFKERAKKLEKNCRGVGTAKSRQVGGEHYQMPIQPIDFITKNKLGFIEGNIIKYVVRHDKKNGLEDLKKAMHYLQMLMEEYE